MNPSEQEREAIVTELLTELDSLRERGANVWASLLAALMPILEGLETGNAIENDGFSNAPVWEHMISGVDVTVAGDVSRALVKFSEALTQHYRSNTPRDHRVSQALALVYLDVQRPLWAAHPDLRPFDLPET
jgi:hypothetical protein